MSRSKDYKDFVELLPAIIVLVAGLLFDVLFMWRRGFSASVFFGIVIIGISFALFITGRSGFKSVFSFFCMHKKMGTMCVLIELFLLGAVIFVYGKDRDNVFHYAGAVFIFILAVLYYFAFVEYCIQKKDIVVLYMVMATVFGCIYMLLIPVNGVPDEPWHTVTAYQVSNELMGISISSKKTVVMRKSDDDYISWKRSGFTSEDYISYWQEIVRPKKEHHELVVTDKKPMNVPAYQHFIQALGILTGRRLGLSTVRTLLLGRFFGLFVWIVMSSLALRLIPFGKTVLLTLLVMPMSLQLSMSFSYDVLVITTANLFISIILRLWYKEGSYTKKDFILLVVSFFCCAVLIQIKGHAYCTLVGLYALLFPKIKTPVLKRIIFWLFIAAISSFTGICIFLHFVPEAIVSGNSDIYTVGYCLNHPREFINVLYNTLNQWGSFVWIDSFIGRSLGWFSIPVDGIACGLTMLLLFLSVLPRSYEKKKFTGKEKIITLLIFLLAVMCIYGGMLVSWSPRSGKAIQGVQGRYLIPIALFPLLCIRSGKESVSSERIDKGIILTIPLIQYFVITSIIPI